MSDDPTAGLQEANGILEGLSPASKTAKPRDAPSKRRKRARADEAELSVELQRTLSKVAVRVMLAQIILADGVFIIYGFSNAWDIPAAAIVAWLSATVVEVIGLVAVITQRLFPTRKPTK